MRIYLLLVMCITLLSCRGNRIGKDEAQKAPAAYTADSSWPQLPAAFPLSQPTGLGVDSRDHLFVFHRAGRRWSEPMPDSLISQPTVLELDSETGRIIQAWGANHFVMPHGLTIDKADNIWLTDVALHQVFKFSRDGKLLMTLGEAKVPGNDASHFNLPTDVAVADDGSFYVSDGYGNSRVVKFSAEGKYIKAWGSFGRKPGMFDIPHGIAIDDHANIYVADRQNNRVQVFDSSGRFLKEIRNNVAVEQLPSVALDRKGRLFAIDYDPSLRKDSTVQGSTFFATGNSAVHYGASGSTERTACWFHDLAIDSKGNIYIGDIIGLKLLKFRPAK